MTSLPGKNPTEHGNRISRPYRREESSASSWAARMFCCLPIPRGRGLGRAHRLGVWERSQCCLRNPPRGLWPFAQRNRNVTGELHPGPGPLSDPTRVTLSPFLLCVHGDFLVYLCLKQAPADVAHKSVGWVCPHPRGHKAGWDWKSPGSTGCPGRLQALRGAPSSRVGT